MEQNGKMDVNFQAPINKLGYGYTGLYVLNSLSKIANVSYFPIGNVDCSDEHVDNIKRCISNAEFFNANAPSLRLWHQFSMAESIGRGCRIGWPIFELDTFTNKEKHNLNSLDKIIVCSEWAKNVCLEQLDKGCEYVFVVPLGVNRDIFKPTAPNVPSAPTIFLNISKWEIRKSHDILIKAFERAFSHSDNVELWMCCDNPFYDEAKNKEWADYYQKSSLGYKVRVIPRQETQQDIARLMNMADCGVFPSRGEGWNLELLEMMSCGKQVVATDYSAHTEFMNDENSYRIGDFRDCGNYHFDVEPAYDGVWFHGQGNWAKITDDHIDQISYRMKLVHKAKQSGRDIVNHAGIETAIEYSWENSTKKLIEAL